MKPLSKSVMDALAAHKYQASVDEILSYVIKERGGMNESNARLLRHSMSGVLSRLKKKGLVTSVGLHDFRMVKKTQTAP